MSEATIKWRLEGGKYFKSTATVGEYELVACSFEWGIYKNGVLVDCLYYHNPPATIDTTTMKVDCERKFRKLLNNKPI